MIKKCNCRSTGSVVIMDSSEISFTSDMASVAVQTIPTRKTDQSSLELANPAMDHMFKELEANVMASLIGIEEMNRQLKADKERQERERETEFVPKPLKGDGSKAMGDALDQLQRSLLSRFSSARGIAGPAVPAAAISAWLSSCSSRAAVQQLGRRSRVEVSDWLADLLLGQASDSARVQFRLHWGDELDSLRLACRQALLEAYSVGPNQLDDGLHQAMLKRPPIVYLHPRYCSASQVEALAVQLCLPMSAFDCQELSSDGTVSPATLAEAMDSMANSKRPLLVQAVCGSSGLGELSELCRSRGVWLHAQGARLAGEASTVLKNQELAPDSACFDFSHLFGLFGLPRITWINRSEFSDQNGLDNGCEDEDAELLLWLPAWLAMQRIGRESALNRPARVRACLQQFTQLLLEHQGLLIQVASADPDELLFGCCESADGGDWLNAETRWLVESLSAAAATAENGDSFHLTLKATPARADDRAKQFDSVSPSPRLLGRYRPQDEAQLPGKQDFQILAGALKDGLQLLAATRELRPEFLRLVVASPNLQPVPLTDWPGLGAVRYSGQAANSGALNRALFEALQSEDAGFTWGAEPGGGEAGASGCLRFGLVPPEADIAGMIAAVLRVGAICDEKVLAEEAIVATLRQGIEAVEQSLANEERERLEQEGLLRQLPFVDSLVNWWSPLPPRPPLPGAALSLNSGQLTSTELTYRYKVQFAQGK